MINLEVFMLLLVTASVITGLTTEAVKTIMIEHNVTYRANTLAGIVALIISIALGAGYIIITDSIFTSETIVCWIALVFLSWLCAMVGYDKVIQAIGQFKVSKSKEE